MKTVLIALFLIVHLLPANAQLRVKYAYDKNNQLTGYEYSGTFTRSYFYDQTGNRTKKNNEQPDFIFVKPNPVNQHFIAYPNPLTGNEIFIQPSDGQVIIYIDLLNINGRKIDIRKEIIHPPVKLTIQEPLPAGVYFLRVESERSIQTLKIIKLKE